MADADVYPVPQRWKDNGRLDAAERQRLYEESLADPKRFWLEQACRLDWTRFPEEAGDWSFDATDFRINWFADGRLNATANCIDRHAETRPDAIAIIWEPDDPAEEARRITYRQLLSEVSRFANVLKANGVGRGDRVTIYMPMIPEAAFALLACARIGAVHSVIFGGFSPESIANRIKDCGSGVIVTANEGRRGGKTFALKPNIDEALAALALVERVIDVAAMGTAITMQPGRDVWYHEEAAKVSADCPPEDLGAEHPLFILYTSGSTGSPKGVVHTTGGISCGPP